MPSYSGTYSPPIVLHKTWSVMYIT